MNAHDARLARMADATEGRFHDVRVAYKDTIVLSEGAFGRAWLKFHKGEQLIYVDDAEGRPRALTPKQYQVLVMALEMIDGIGVTMREMGRILEVAPSTVSRALTKLASWGLIGYICGRGRWAGLVIFRRAKDDGLDRFRQAAKARVRRWSEAAQRRISRLWVNVAPYALEEKGYQNPYYFNIMSNTTYKGATLTAQPFTVQELRDAGII